MRWRTQFNEWEVWVFRSGKRTNVYGGFMSLREAETAAVTVAFLLDPSYTVKAVGVTKR